MHNIHTTPLLSTWVKNVYSLCVEGIVTGVQSYTGSLKSMQQAASQRVQLAFSTNTINSFAPTLYTANFTHFNLLSKHLYTLSTIPTIKKTKKI